MRYILPTVIVVVMVSLLLNRRVETKTVIHPLEPQLQVGFASVDITPEVGEGKKPVYMAGFGHNRIAKGVNDPLYARAVVLSDGQKKIALVSLDLVGFFYGDAEKIRGTLRGFDYVMISSTHNHEGPDTMGLWGASPMQSGIDEKYVHNVIEKTVICIREAEKKLAPAVARWGTAKAPELLHDGRIPQIKQDELTVLQFVDSTNSEKLLGLMVNWHCHPETLSDKNTMISADYVGFTVEALAKQYHCPVAYFTGVVGGLMTSLHVPIRDAQGNELKDGTLEKTKEYGLRLARVASDAVSKSSPVTLTPFMAKKDLIYLPLQNPLYKLGRTLGVLQRQAYRMEEGKPRAVAASESSGELYVQSEVAVLRLGEVSAACIPGEIYPEIVSGGVPNPAEAGADFPDAAIEPLVFSSLPGQKKLVFGLANDELGYILPKRQWDDKPPFCYGRKTKQYGEVNSIGPEAGPIICGKIAELGK